MKFKIHYDTNYNNEFIEDNFIITGNTISDIREKVNQELAKRGLTIGDNNIWTEELK
jgi:hypothetical protein